MSFDPKNGTGNWENFQIPLERIFAEAAVWKAALGPAQRCWLCWNVSGEWSRLQQRLVRHVGWTPVVGFDPRVGPPPLEPGSILIDFNAGLQLPVMWPHFPLEFAFLWAGRLAFWHADLLCRIPVVERLARMFEKLEDGQMAAVFDRGGRRNLFNSRYHRYWELCGCTTRGASENQFYNGTGWWRNFAQHPKCTLPEERARRLKWFYDSGMGILYWQKKYNGSIVPIDVRMVDEGHCSEIGARNYKPAPHHLTAQRSLASELDANYSLPEVARRLGIAHLL